MHADRIRLTVPVPLLPPRESDWAEYRDAMVKMGAQRVLIFAPMDSIIRKTVERNGGKAEGPYRLADAPDLAYYAAWSSMLKERIRFFASACIETGFWLGHSIGHGGSLSAGAEGRFQQIVGAEGTPVPGCFCPLDPAFREYISNALAIMAESGVGLLILDDDFRLHRHDSEGVSCFCPLHLKAFAEKTGECLSREEAYQKVFVGGPSRCRDLWLESAGASLLSFAFSVEKAVHAVNPAARIGLCTAMTLWSHEGVDMKDLLKAFAGKTRPFLRTIGAPYWSREPSYTGFIVEYTLQQNKWLECHDVEVLAEGDTFPHSRFQVPAESLIAFREGLAVSGFNRLLAYPFLYVQTPSREPGYCTRLIVHRERQESLCRFFPEDYRALGVAPVLEPNSFACQVLPTPPDKALLHWPDDPVILGILPRLGLPVAFDGSGPVVFSGYGAAGLDDPAINKLLDRGAMVDAPAAEWLIRRGFDIGATGIAGTQGAVFEHFLDPSLSGKYAGDQIWLLTGGSNVYYHLETAPEAVVAGEFTDSEGDKRWPSVTVYENRDGRRVCVCAFSFHNAKGGRLLFSYARQEQWARIFGWLGRKPLAVTIPGEPNVRIVCRMAADGRRIAIAVQNLRLDPLEDPVLRLHPGIVVGRQVEVLAPDSSNPVKTSDVMVSEADGYRILKVRTTIPAMGLLGVGLPQTKALLHIFT